MRSGNGLETSEVPLNAFVCVASKSNLCFYKVKNTIVVFRFFPFYFFIPDKKDSCTLPLRRAPSPSFRVYPRMAG